MFRNIIELTIDNRMLDIPFADSMYNKERWIIMAPYENATKIIARATDQVIFEKMVMFKSKIFGNIEPDFM